MKSGYSILLGETIDAKTVQYRDCERFQIVCLHCREPVFKVRRTLGGQSDQHYLAHYSAGASYQGECDLRAAQIDRSEQERQNHVSRDQRLAYFLNVLRRTLAMAPVYAESAEKSHWRMDHSPGIVCIRDLAWAALSQGNRGSSFDECAIDYLARLDEAGWSLATSFSLGRQRQIARDMWLTITSNTGHSNFNYVFNHALMQVVGNLPNMRNHSPQEIAITRQMAEYLQLLWAAKKSDVNVVLQKMLAHQFPKGFSNTRGVDVDDRDDSEDRSTYFTRLLGNTTIEMIGTLLAFPYFELLKQQYGDSSKVYPYQPGIEPVDPDEVAKLKAFREKVMRDRMPPSAH
ncbi:hypothetical protein BLA39750_01274 [Burkholderia lata]|uniref:Uncharacterized protein n=1 Tax=Burkholderia lata (strain ATCC 17760 / DSM 23089 / LMG 22485 / NCIMB 9086 / R18194 / 383) TaxID=482957 RepID=A0A6P2VIL5_BURL3|nr:hypothetical protein [Burkholderia lata]VWC82045.1 hypothetical protein BLA39750_01274 [Burkholderia lata]